MAVSQHRSIAGLDLAMFRRLLLRWYGESQRKLPWRGAADPYHILVSEIMLQQTRVAVVEERYTKFIAQFPTVERLARAKEATVLAAWSGLGYYRRARALYGAAKEIVRRGSASTNGEKQYWEIAGELLDRESPGDFNQAMMELGALVCLPAQPMCHACPVAVLCGARGPTEKAQRPPRRKAELHYALARRDGSVLLRQRNRQNSLMPGMWELPEIEAPNEDRLPLLKLRHSITTTDYTVYVHAGKKRKGHADRWIPLRSVYRLPLTGLTRKIIRGVADA